MHPLLEHLHEPERQNNLSDTISTNKSDAGIGFNNIKYYVIGSSQSSGSGLFPGPSIMVTPPALIAC